MNKQGFIKGAAILAAAGIVCKLLGALYRIPLGNLIGAEGMGLYHLAYPIYSLLLVISTSGLPTAISKLVAEREARGDSAGAYFIFKSALGALWVIGTAGAAAMMLLGRPIAAAMGNEDAAFAILAVAPSLWFVALISAYRGMFQGMQKMGATAISQLVEQGVKLLCGLALAAAWARFGAKYGAAGALLGVSISEAAALLLLVLCYTPKLKEYRAGGAASKKQQRGILKEIFSIALPITAGACLIPLVSAIDSFVVLRALLRIGYDESGAASLFGLFSGFVMPIVNMPAVLSVAAGMSLVPSVAAAAARGQTRFLQKQVDAGIRLSMIIGLPSSLGLYLLSEPILKILYPVLSAAQLAVCSGLMREMAASVVLLTLVQTMTGILQGLGATVLPVLNLLLGAAVKVVVGIALICVPSLNISGAAIGTIACYAVAAILDLVCVLRVSGIGFSFLDCLLRPAAAAGIMGLIVGVCYRYSSPRFSGGLALCCSILAGAAAYGILLLVFRVVRPEDLRGIPFAQRLIKRRAGEKR